MKKKTNKLLGFYMYHYFFYIVFFFTLSCSKKVAERDSIIRKTSIGSINSFSLDNEDYIDVDFSSLDKIVGSGKSNNVYWLNFDGAQVIRESTRILDRLDFSTVNVPLFQPEVFGILESSREIILQKILEEVQKIYSSYQIEFSLKKPEVNHSVVYIGGSDFRDDYSSIGLSFLDLKNFSTEDDIFVFPLTFLSAISELTSSTDRILVLAHAIAHQVGHSLGLKHISNENAIMGTNISMEDINFSAGDLSEGGGSQDSRVLLQEVLGLKDNNSLEKIPQIIGLSTIYSETVIQYSVFSTSNVNKNPNLNLDQFSYFWTIGDATVEGSSVRVPESLRVGSLQLEIKSEKFSANKFFSFE